MTNLFGQEQWARRGELLIPHRSVTADMLADGAVTSRTVSAGALPATVITSDAWTIHTPTLTQSGAVTKTVDYSSYQRIGRGISWQFVITVTGTGTAANRALLSLPVNAAAATVGPYVGGGGLYDSSTGTLYFGQWTIFDATTIGFQSQVGDLWGVLPNLALGAGDVLKGTAVFEAAT